MQAIDYMASLRARDAELRIEAAVFIEEQSIRHSLGGTEFQALCGLIQIETRNINEEFANRIIVKRTPLSMYVKDSETARVLTLKYDNRSACIHYKFLGQPEKHIVFRVDKFPAPSLMPMHNGVPCLTMELAGILMASLIAEEK